MSADLGLGLKLGAVAENRGIAITGMGLLTPLGDRPAAVFEALLAGRTAISASPAGGGKGHGVIAEFDAANYATVRGMRMYNRATRLAICASKLAQDDARFDPTTLAAEDLGVLMASTYGHIDVLMTYDRSLVTSGVQRTNGALMPLAIPSATGAMVALALGAKAFSMTLSDGASSGLDALALGARWVEDGRAKACVVAGAFSPSAELLLALARAGATGQRRDAAGGPAFGEAGIAFVLERADDAKARGVRPYGYVRGYGAAFSGAGAGSGSADERGAAPGNNLSARSLRRAAAGAVAGAGVTPEQIGVVSAGASGAAEEDRAEAEGLAALFTSGDAGKGASVPAMATKGAFGETFDAASGLQCFAALLAMRARKTPPNVGGAGRPPWPDRAGVRYSSEHAVVERGLALVTTLAQNGTCSALVLSDDEQSE